MANNFSSVSCSMILIKFSGPGQVPVFRLHPHKSGPIGNLSVYIICIARSIYISEDMYE
jgi:hypothetical protein